MSTRKWLSPAVIGGCIIGIHIIGVLNLVTAWSENAYWQSGGYAAVAPILFSSPLFAAWAAWQAWRLRRGSGLHSTATRTPGRVLLWWYGPLLFALVALTVTTALVVTIRSTGQAGATSIAALIVLLPVAILGAIGWGLALGRLLPVAVSVPVSVLSLYLTLSIPMTLLPFRLRHVVGVHLNCCFIDREPAASAVVSAVIFWILLAASCVLGAVVLPNVRWAPFACLIVAGVVGFNVLAAVTPDLDADGSQARPSALLRCGKTKPSVCLWPEHEQDRLITENAVSIVASTLGKAGVEVPAQATEAYPAIWSINAQADPQSALWNVAVGLSSSSPPPCARTEEWSMGQYSNVMSAWVAGLVGIDQTQIDSSFGPDAVSSAKRKEEEPLERQGQWFQANLAKLSQCSVQPTK